MNRRTLLKFLAASAVTASQTLAAGEALAAKLSLENSAEIEEGDGPVSEHDLPNHHFSDDYFSKLKNFNQPHPDDIYLTGRYLDLMQSCWLKLKKTQDTVGYGNFNVISYDKFLKVCRSYGHIGAVLPEEETFIEKLFYADATKYGFFGERVFTSITHDVPAREIAELPGTGHWLFRDESMPLFYKLNKHIGTSLVMTSGVRGVAKQMHLFLNRAVRNRGNLSLTSRAIAPPGYSFHGCGDFDIGRNGWGYRNFTSEFETTSEFKELYKMGYVRLRYPFGNTLGVRYEPWHVKTTKKI